MLANPMFMSLGIEMLEGLDVQTIWRVFKDAQRLARFWTGTEAGD